MSTIVSTIGKVATFVRGFNLLMPFQLCMVGSSFAMRRFGYGNEAVPIFVAFCSNSMELMYMFGNLSTLAIVTILKATVPSMFNQIVLAMSIVAACLSVVLNALLLRTYAMDEDEDNVAKYYWLLVLANFAAGIDDTFILTIASDDLSPFELGYNTGGLVVVCFHWVVIRLLENWSMDVDYWLIVLQLVFMVCFSIFAASLWFWYLFHDKILVSSGHTVSSGDAVKYTMGYLRCAPMVLASAVALGYLWAVYPYISPYEMVEFKYQYPVQRSCLVARATSGFINFILGQYGGVRQDWYEYPYALWHLLWLCLVPYLGIGILFLRCMHYPESGMPRAVLGRPFVVGCLTVIFYIIGRVTQGTSGMAIARNAGDNLKEIISPLNRTISLAVMNILKYLSEAYLQQLRLAKEGVKAGKAWPTDGMSKHSAVRYWIGIAATVGYTNFKEMTTADVKQRLGGVARHIVSHNRVSSVVHSDVNGVLV